MPAFYYLPTLVGFDAEKGKQRKVEQDFDSEDVDLVMRDMGDMDIEQLGDSISAPNSLGNSTVKQYLCGIGYLQLAQHHLLFGDMQVPKLSSLSILTTDARTRRRNENQRKNDSLMDAARHVPQIRDPIKERKMMDSFMNKQGAFQQAAGLRNACLWTYQMATASRGEQVRNLRECQRLNFDIEPEEDSGGSLQTMQLIAFTKDGGKTSPGDIRDLAAVGLHKDVSDSCILLHLGCCLKDICLTSMILLCDVLQLLLQPQFQKDFYLIASHSLSCLAILTIVHTAGAPGLPGHACFVRRPQGPCDARWRTATLS